MEFSISLNTSDEPKFHNNYVVRSFDNWQQILPLITKHFWSPIVWLTGRRKGENFFFSDLFVLDFDEGGWSIDDATEFCELGGYSYVIATTRSHRVFKPKGGACDRFRVIIPWTERIKDRNQFNQNMVRLTKKFPADQACVDAARIFRPSGQIVKCVQNGKGMPFKAYIPPPKREPTPYYGTGILPRWLREMTLESPAEGMRDKHAFKLAAKLAEHGFTEQQIIDVVLAAPIDLPKQELLKSAKSGYSARRR